MRPATLYAIFTNHGFGHASRSLAVLREAHRLAPDLRIILNTTVPEAFVRSMLGDTPVERRARPLDVGIRQKDFLKMDLSGTLRAARELYFEQAGERLVAQEARFIESEGVALVFADIPPLAADVAARAGVPCWMLGNFGWDFIYRAYAGHDADFARLADRIVESYAKCERLFRPPFSEGETMDRVFPRVTEVGLTGVRPRFSREEVLRRLGLSDGSKELEGELVLLSFGGLGLEGVPYERLAEFDGRRRPARRFLTFDRAAPPLRNLKIVSDPDLRQIDLLPFVERIVSKPGHGTFCEVAHTGTPFVCLDREDFPETSGLLGNLRNYFTHRVVPLPEFFAGDWDFVTAALTPPRSRAWPADAPLDGSVEPDARDGSAAVARSIVEYFQNAATGLSAV